MANILYPFTGQTSSYIKDSRHFIQTLADVTIADTEIMVSFDVTSLYTNVPVDETIKIITELITNAGLPSRYVEWTRYCLESCYFLWQDEFYLQIDGVAMGSPIAPVAANIFMEWFEKEVADKAPKKPRYWWRYVDDVFAIIEREALVDFLSHLNSIHDKIQFTVEKEKDGILPFLDVKVIREAKGTLSHTVYRKPTHTDRYLQADSHHHPSHLSSVPRSLINRALALCDPKHVDGELRHVRSVLEANGYSWHQCSRWTHGNERKRPVNVERSPVYLPYVRGVTDKIGYLLRRRYDIKTVFRSPGQLRHAMRSPKDKDSLNVPGVYKIPCECGLSYIGETRRNIKTRLMEHIRAVKKVDYDKSAIAEHSDLPGIGHFIRFDQASVLAREKFWVPRKIRETIEINRHPNFNRDRGWMLSQAWKPILANTSSTSRKTPSINPDTISSVCDARYVQSTSSDQSQPNAVAAIPTAGAAARMASATTERRPSEREQRAMARSLRKAIGQAAAP